LKDENQSSTTAKIVEFSDSFTRDLELITSIIAKEEKHNGLGMPKYIIKGFELTRDYQVFLN
jgi:type II secretory pathway component HofQ